MTSYLSKREQAQAEGRAERFNNESAADGSPDQSLKADTPAITGTRVENRAVAIKTLQDGHRLVDDAGTVYEWDDEMGPVMLPLNPNGERKLAQLDPRAGAWTVAPHEPVPGYVQSSHTHAELASPDGDIRLAFAHIPYRTTLDSVSRSGSYRGLKACHVNDDDVIMWVRRK